MDDQERTPLARRALLVGAASASVAWIAQLVGASPAGARARRGTRPALMDPVRDGDSLRVGMDAAGSSTTQVLANSTSTGVIGLLAKGPTGAHGLANSPSEDAAGVLGMGGLPSYGVLSSGKLGTTSTLELRKQTSGVGTVPGNKVYIYFKELADGTPALVARFPNGVERTL